MLGSGSPSGVGRHVLLEEPYEEEGELEQVGGNQGHEPGRRTGTGQLCEDLGISSPAQWSTLSQGQHRRCRTQSNIRLDSGNGCRWSWLSTALEVLGDPVTDRGGPRYGGAGDEQTVWRCRPRGRTQGRMWDVREGKGSVKPRLRLTTPAPWRPHFLSRECGLGRTKPPPDHVRDASWGPRWAG